MNESDSHTFHLNCSWLIGQLSFESLWIHYIQILFLTWYTFWADCGILKPHNGSINSSSTNYGSVVKVTCDKDFKLIGDEIISCQITGIWSDRPKCELIGTYVHTIYSHDFSC